MSTMYINCAYCGCELGSAHDMVILDGNSEVIRKAAHPDCYLEALNEYHTQKEEL